MYYEGGSIAARLVRVRRAPARALECHGSLLSV